MTQTYYFLHTTSGRSWPTDDPHCWLLDHRNNDVLAPARERLVFSADDEERCLRAALRRCGLAFVRIVTDSQIVVRYWSDPAPDLRTWAKMLGWNRRGVQVVVVQEKSGKAIIYEDGRDVFMYGEMVGSTFPWGVYEAKYERRLAEERDDHDTTSASVTNFTWEGSPPERLTWRVLKSIWNAERVACPNCDQPLILVAFEWHKGMLSFRSGKVVRHCFRCQRRFEVSEEKPLAWLASVLPAPLRPTHLRVWAAIPIDWLRMSPSYARPVQLAAGDG